MTRDKKTYLSTPDFILLKRYCKGCQYFESDRSVRNICTFIAWYNKHNIDEVIDYVKQCPCNDRCLVKASCRDEDCPMWMSKVKKVIEERSQKLWKIQQEKLKSLAKKRNA